MIKDQNVLSLVNSYLAVELKAQENKSGLTLRTSGLVWQSGMRLFVWRRGGGGVVWEPISSLAPSLKESLTPQLPEKAASGLEDWMAEAV